MTPLARQIADRLAEVHERVATAAERSRRTLDAVTLIAVTKYVSASVAAAAVEAGCRDLGESRPQELWAKAAELADPRIRWHFVGHLQRNKIRRTLPLVHLVQSVDSLRVLEAISSEALTLQRDVPLLIEVNISGDASKTGLPPAELPQLLEQSQRLGGIAVRGLMGMASLEGDEVAARRDFRALRELRDAMQAHYGLALPELSMGMSGDFEIAIEEGATIIRLGSILFA